MIEVPAPDTPLTEGLLQLAVAQHVGWWRHTVVPNLCLWHEMDVAVLTRAGCLWEFEIKVSQADFNRDRLKDAPKVIPPRALEWMNHLPNKERWIEQETAPQRNLSNVSRFTYVYAAGLTVPEWVPEWAGLIEARVESMLYNAGWQVRLDPVRAAKTRRVPKPSEAHVRKMYEAVYYRFWRQVKQLPVAEQARRAPTGEAP